MRNPDDADHRDRAADASRTGRRGFLAAAGASALAGLAGCSAFNLTSDEVGGRSAPTTARLVSDRPDAVYYPTHVDGMQTSGVRRANGYACALTYTAPHRFWLVSGTERTRVPIQASDGIHVMPVVWHEASGRVLTDVNPVLRFRDDDALVTSDAPWPMLAQHMGYHYGDNVVIDPGTYDVTVRVGAPAARRTGALTDAPDGATFDFTLAYSQAELDAISVRSLRNAGDRGAVEPMGMQKIATASVPAADALPGRVLGTDSVGDATIAATVVDDAVRFGGDESQAYLAVSPRTPYNRYPLPETGLRAIVAGDTYDLTETLDDELGLHYGALLDAAPDAVTVALTLPPQVARHEGYETAFLRTGSVELGD